MIQADFILSANREAVPDNDWNSALRLGAVHAFGDAVDRFRETSNHLRYQWMRYLPSSELDGFWDPLFDLLKQKLTSSPILESRQGQYRSAEQLRSVPGIFLVDEEPLVSDLPDHDVYLSNKYADDDIRLLRRLDLTNLSNDEMLVRIREDSARSDGRLRSVPLSERWHDLFIELIDHLSEDSSNRTAINELKFIPLSDRSDPAQSWVAPSEARLRSVYTPYAINAYEGTIRVLIPQEIGLRTLHTEAYQESDRVSFYANRGISDCPNSVIIKSIKEKRKLGGPDYAQNFLRYLEIFFWYDQPDMSLLPISNGSIQAFDQNYVLRNPQDLFLPTTQAFDAVDLLSRTTLNADSAYGMLHQRYLDSPVRGGIPHGKTWEQWLKHRAGIQCYPSLVIKRNGQLLLNPVLETVARDNPTKFLPNLRAHWQASYVAEPWKSVKGKISSTVLPCCDGQSHPLERTILPCESILAEARSFGLSNRLPFLVLPTDAMAGGTESWQFLKSFDVLCDIDLRFYLSVLSFIRRDSAGIDLNNVCIQIYEKIADKANRTNRKKIQVSHTMRMFSTITPKLS